MMACVMYTDRYCIVFQQELYNHDGMCNVHRSVLYSLPMLELYNHDGMCNVHRSVLYSLPTRAI